MRKNLDLNLKKIIIALEKAGKKGQKYFLDVAEDIDVPSRRAFSVNLSKIELLASKNNKAVFVVPGKILGTGVITKKVNIYAFSYSEVAAKKLANIGVKAKNLEELIAEKPKNVILVK